MVKTVTSIQVTANDTVAFYNGTDVVMTLSQIMPPSVYIDYSNTSIVIYNQANSSDEKTKFEFPAVYVQQVGANSYTKLNSYALQTEITARVMQVYKDLTTQIFKGCCEAGGCQADGCAILYRYNSELNEGDWYYDSEGGILRMSMNSFSNQLFDSLLPAMPIDSWVTFISSADSTLYAVFQITNAGTIVGGYVEYEATLVDGSSTFPVNTVFCFNLMAAGGSPVIGIASGNAGITVGGSYPSYTISNAMTITAAAGINITGTYPNYTIGTNSANTTLASAGGTESLVNDGTGPTLAIKGITAGSGITLSSTATELTISSTGGGGSGIPFAIASGTDTYTATVTGATAYADGDAYIIRFTNGNTNQSTLDIYNGTSFLGAKTLYKNNDGPLIGGDIWDGGEMICIYNSANDAFSCIGTSPNTLFAYVTNDQGSTITRGQAVYAFGGTGNRMTVKLAQANTDATSAQTIGFVFSTSIAANQKGIIIIQGYFTGLSLFPTATWNDGDPVYLSPTTAGAVTKTKPYAPDHLVYLGVVASANNGSSGRMYVRVQNGYELDELHNVQAQNPNLNDTLWYDSAVSPGQWKTASIPTILGYTPVTNARTISTTAPLSGGGDLTADRTLSIADAVADGSTKGAAAFTASDFNSSSGVISIDYTNGQSASSSTKGFLTSGDWSTFNSKVSATNLTYFGDGSAGVVTITSNSATLLADTYYQDLTITGSGSLNCKGFRVFVSGTLDLTGAGANGIYQNGLTGAAGAGFSGGTNGTSAGKLGFGRTVYGGAETSLASASEVVGGNGGATSITNGVAAGTATAAGTNNYRIGGAGGAGGKGGNGAAGTGGNGSAGQVNGTAPASGYIPLIRTIGVFGLLSHVELSPSTSVATSTLVYPGLNGGGGGGSAGSGIASGGGGGAGGGGGGNLYIYAKTVSIGASTNSAALSATGGAGGNASNGANNNTGGGGGGAGGGGGYVFLLCNSITGGNFTFISANGGSGGNAGNGVGTGIGGQGGTGGSGGRITVIRISDGTITQVNGTTNAGATPTAPTTGTAGTAGGSGGTCTYTA